MLQAQEVHSKLSFQIEATIKRKAATEGVLKPASQLPYDCAAVLPSNRGHR